MLIHNNLNIICEDGGCSLLLNLRYTSNKLLLPRIQSYLLKSFYTLISSILELKLFLLFLIFNKIKLNDKSVYFLFIFISFLMLL